MVFFFFQGQLEGDIPASNSAVFFSVVSYFIHFLIGKIHQNTSCLSIVGLGLVHEAVEVGQGGL